MRSQAGRRGWCLAGRDSESRPPLNLEGRMRTGGKAGHGPPVVIDSRLVCWGAWRRDTQIGVNWGSQLTTLCSQQQTLSAKFTTVRGMT